MTTTFDIEFPRLSTDKVYLFYADVRALEEINASTSERWLNHSEQSRLERFYFERDSKLYQLSHCMLRWVLSHYTGQLPEHLEFAVNQYGKPSLKGDTDISFNLSHSNETTVLAIGKNYELGVDLEEINYQKEIRNILDHFFHPDEILQFKALNGAQKSELFFKLWTLKEAYIKAKGLGLSIPLNAFNFDCSQAPILDVFFQTELNEKTSPWQFSLFESLHYDNFLTAVAVKSAQASIEAYNVRLSNSLISPHKLRSVLQTKS
ncbi:MAG: 4'-phosphopantetheinyl transferase [Oleiphilaceae bacterium]